MSIAIQVTTDGAAVEPVLLGLLRLSGRQVHERVAARAENLTRDYLRSIAAERHRSARRLGASPTGHLGRAAESVSSAFDAETATVSISSPGISRVAGPVKIRPKKAKNLTIPIHRLSYGRTVAQVRRITGQRLFRPGPKRDPKRILAIVRDKELVPLYALTDEVTLPQDRTLLPSDHAYHQAGLAGIRDYVSFLLRHQNPAVS